MKELIENIKGCPDSAMGIWVGSIYLGTVEDAQALVNAYTQLKADLANKDMAEKIRTMKDYYDRYFPNRDKNCQHCFCRKSWFSNTAKCCHCKKEIKI